MSLTFLLEFDEIYDAYDYEELYHLKSIYDTNFKIDGSSFTKWLIESDKKFLLNAATY